MVGRRAAFYPVTTWPGWQPHPRAGQPIPAEWWARPATEVARALLGARLVRRWPDGITLAGVILEAEAYGPEDDQGCHCRAGRTRRTQGLYGPPGHAYVYFTYGMHWLFNVVTFPDGVPGAVLVRALWPTEDSPAWRARVAGRPWARALDGPAKLCRALAIDGRFYGHDVTDPRSELYLLFDGQFADEAVTQSPRVGLNTVPEPWRSIPWRWRVRPPRMGGQRGPRSA
ncbi:MAG: DNA-3-methyladenine glycosylase [Chloroflexi bacterium]|nr:DNA-3-methyladenine glycosylase [Chloroflexota bacterium]